MGIQDLQGAYLKIAAHVASGLNFLLFGYDQGLLGGVLSTDQFIAAYGHNPTDTIVGTTSAIYSIGAFVGCICAAIFGLTLGRRRTLIVSCFFVIIGAVIQAASPTLNVMIAGRVVAGLGVGANTSTVPIWIAEISSTKNRGRGVAIQLEIVLVGFMFAYWFTYGMSFVQSEISFRLPMAAQAVFPIAALPLLYILPESPRVLFKWGRHDEGAKVLARLHSTSTDDPVVQAEEADILAAIEIEDQATDSVLKTLVFDKSTIRYRRRALITFTLFLLQQFGGCTFVAYYAPIIFGTSVGLSRNLSAIMSCVMATTYAVGGVIPILVIDRLGRRKMMLWGACATSAAFVSLTALVSHANDSQAVAWAAAIMVIVFILFFAMSWDVLPWIYASELMPLNMRHINGAIGAAGEWIFQFTVLEMAPRAILTTGWKIYIFFAVFNVLTFVFVYFFCPETNQKSLEEINFIFEQDYDHAVDVLHSHGIEVLHSHATKSYSVSQDPNIQILNSNGEKPVLQAEV